MSHSVCAGKTPPLLIIPSADFGGLFRSVFDPEGWDDGNMLLDVDEQGLPVRIIDAVTAVTAVSSQLERIAGRDARARYWPNEPYAAPISPERWLQLLDQTIDDLSWARVRIAQEIVSA